MDIAGQRKRVAIVESDPIVRAGLQAILAEDPSVGIIASSTHEDAAAHLALLSTADVLLVGAEDQHRAGDQFPGVQTVRDLRQVACRRPPQVVAVSGVVYDDAIRRRMREAGTQYFFHRSDLVDAATACLAVTDPAKVQARRPMHDRNPERLGVTEQTRVNLAIDAALSEGLINGSAAVGPRGRARTARRERFNRQAQLSPRTYDGGTIDRDQRAPSLPQISRFLEWAMHIDSPWLTSNS